MNVLFLQESPCIRNWKMVVALRGAGHTVTLGYTRRKLSEMYAGMDDGDYDRVVHLSNLTVFRQLVAEHDIVHCHNEPDFLTVRAMGGMGPPVVHDTHDAMSLRGQADVRLERAAQQGAAGNVYTSEAQAEWAQETYGVPVDQCLVFHNILSRRQLPAYELPKLSLLDGEPHVVYEGSIGDERLPHRDYRKLFTEMAEGGIHIHIYPNYQHPAYVALSQKVERFHLHAPVSPLEIVQAMTQYDYGIAPLVITETNRRHLDSVLPNKPFEYAAAGLPLLLQNCKMMQRYWSGRTDEDGWAIAWFFASAVDIEIIERGSPVHIPPKDQVRFYEDEIGSLVSFYERILAADRREQHRRAAETLAEVFPDRISEMYDGKLDAKSGELARERMAAMLAECDGRVLDVGCSQGILGRLCKEKSLEYVGVDISPEAVKQTQAEGCDAQVAWGDALPFGDGEFDTVVLGELLEHVPDPDAVLAEAARVLRPDGKAVITAPAQAMPSLGHARDLDKEEWYALINKHLRTMFEPRKVGVHWLFVAVPKPASKTFAEPSPTTEEMMMGDQPPVPSEPSTRAAAEQEAAYRVAVTEVGESAWDKLVARCSSRVYGLDRRYEAFTDRLGRVA